MAHLKRSERVGDLLLKEISQILLKEIKDPRIGFATLTKVEVSKDLRYSKVYVSILGEEAEKISAMEGLSSAAGYIRGELWKRLRIKYIPELTFKLDNSIEYGDHIAQILEKIKKES
jgi:ribosome-binding factor A